MLHFVTGGFTGATQVAIDLVEGALRRGTTQPLLVLRRKRHTDPVRVAQLQARGVPLALVPAWPKWRVVGALVRCCREFRPDIFVAHGFSEHLWGRYAGLLARVPMLVQVEHGWERYGWVRLWQSRWLARRTTHIVTCSEGLRERLEELGFPAARLRSILNGIRLDAFVPASLNSFAERTPGIIMPARFASSKDHPTLLRALALMRAQGLRPTVLLAGRGKASHRRIAERLCRRHGLEDQVRFLGRRDDLPALLMGQQICVLATWREGLPLALIEGMAAGCAVVGSDIPGVRELIVDRQTGRLVPPGDAPALAGALAELLHAPQFAARLGAAACAQAHARHSLEHMVDQYDELFRVVPNAARESPGDMTVRSRTAPRR